MRRLTALLVGLALALLACTPQVASPSAPPTDAPANSSLTEGSFRLTFELPKTTWKADETVTGRSELVLIAGTSATLAGSGGGPLAFAFVSIDGKHRVEPAWTADCATHQLKADSPITSAITKSGGFSQEDPDYEFLHSFLAEGGTVRLPAGDWDVSAIAMFSEGAGCSGPNHDMRATVRIHVTP